MMARMNTVQVSVDRNSRTPLHIQLAEQLEAAITGGQLPVGARLSNEIELAETYGLSRPTVRQAIARLVDQGLLVRKRGVGTQVVGGAAQVRRSLELTSLYDDLAARGRRPQTEVLRLGSAGAPGDVADALGCESGDRVLRIERLRLADGEPLALLRNWIPTDVLDTDADTLVEHGLYELLRADGVRLKVAHQTISAVPAGARARPAARRGRRLAAARHHPDHVRRPGPCRRVRVPSVSRQQVLLRAHPRPALVP